MEVLNFALSVLIGLLLLVLLVVLHELGHAIVARRNGVVVEEFGVGFPPRAWAKKLKNGVLLSVNWLPLGGFVKLQGEHDSANKKGDYGAVSLWAKTKILLAGVAVNWLTAVLLLTILAAVGLPKIIPNQFSMAGDTVVDRQPVTAGRVVEGLPADIAGIKTGDVIVSVAGQELFDASELSEITKNYKGKAVDIVVERGGKMQVKDVTLRADNIEGDGYLGVAASQQKRTTYRSTWSAPVVGFALTGQLTSYTLTSLGDMVVQLFSGIFNKLSLNSETRDAGGAQLAAVSSNVGGPLAILGMIFPAAVAEGPAALLLITALISLTLAVMNILPIPALDGGRWFVTMIYRLILRKPLTKDREEQIHGIGFMVLIGLVLLITVADVGKFIR